MRNALGQHEKGCSIALLFPQRLPMETANKDELIIKCEISIKITTLSDSK